MLLTGLGAASQYLSLILLPSSSHADYYSATTHYTLPSFTTTTTTTTTTTITTLLILTALNPKLSCNERNPMSTLCYSAKHLEGDTAVVCGIGRIICIGFGSIGIGSAGFGISIDLVLQCSALRDMRERRPWNWFSPTPPSPTSSGAQGESKGSRERGGHNWSQLYHFASRPLLQAR